MNDEAIFGASFATTIATPPNERADVSATPIGDVAKPLGLPQPARSAVGSVLKRTLDAVVSAVVLVLLAPLIVLIAIAIKADSRGPVFYRCRRVGYRGHDFEMLKFRKMVHDASGPALTAASDPRFTSMGRLLARTKVDELPQLWNVLKGQMSLVGPRPEDPAFVALHRTEYERITGVRPGITGPCQLAFAKESEILDGRDGVDFYVRRLLPQKVAIDVSYATRPSLALDLRILVWTIFAVISRADVAVHRETLAVSRRRRVVPTATALELVRND
jgi:lipopolysaccharide/colanic/teichoic acid biosynthesis glycosyltransferase